MTESIRLKKYKAKKNGFEFEKRVHYGLFSGNRLLMKGDKDLLKGFNLNINQKRR